MKYHKKDQKIDILPMSFWESAFSMEMETISDREMSDGSDEESWEDDSQSGSMSEASEQEIMHPSHKKGRKN